ncbi:MAG: segregation ATPase FtsK/SpoIIIE, family, partial [Acidimicrobiaceae bacterium]
MHLVFDDGDREWELTVEVRDPAATVGDLLAALAPSAADAAVLVVAGRALRPSSRLADAGLHDGDRVAVRSASSGTGVREGVPLELAVVGGLDAGGRHPLPVGRVVLGREQACDVVLLHPSVSR